MPGTRKHITPEKLQAFSKAVASGQPLKNALVEHLGYSQESANRGKACLSKGIQAQLASQGIKLFAEIGKSFSAQDQENYVRGKALTSSLEGSDKGFNMLKLLAQDKRVNMLTPDSVAGIVVIEAPRSIPALSDSTHTEQLTGTNE